MDSRDRPLQESRCVPCRSGAPALSREESAALLKQVPGWRLVAPDGVERIERVFKFPDFASALRFTDAIGALAEEEDHHPAILTEWGRVTVRWWTHKIRGLHRNDFIMASRTDGVFVRMVEER